MANGLHLKDIIECDFGDHPLSSRYRCGCSRFQVERGEPRIAVGYFGVPPVQGAAGSFRSIFRGKWAVDGLASRNGECTHLPLN
jgi:hypothetical protein